MGQYSTDTSCLDPVLSVIFYITVGLVDQNNTYLRLSVLLTHNHISNEYKEDLELKEETGHPIEEKGPDGLPADLYKK